jgi:hypothetical protein
VVDLALLQCAVQILNTAEPTPGKHGSRPIRL